MMRATMRGTFGRAALLLALAGGVAVAQGEPADRARRDSLEARVRVRMAQVLRNQLGLSDEQVRRVQATNQRFERQRRQLFDDERRVRGELRAAIASDDSAQEARIGPLLDRTLHLQRQRLDLLEAEQKELATFLTPRQRARLFGIEEQMRRRVEEMREGGAAGPPRRGPGGGPGGGPASGPGAGPVGRPGMRPGGQRPMGPGQRPPLER